MPLWACVYACACTYTHSHVCVCICARTSFFVCLCCTIKFCSHSCWLVSAWLWSVCLPLNLQPLLLFDSLSYFLVSFSSVSLCSASLCCSLFIFCFTASLLFPVRHHPASLLMPYASLSLSHSNPFFLLLYSDSFYLSAIVKILDVFFFIKFWLLLEKYRANAKVECDETQDRM